MAKQSKTPKKETTGDSKSPGHHKVPKYEQNEAATPLSNSTYQGKKGGKK